MLAGAPVIVMGQNPGEEEEAAGEPFVGRTGQRMEQDFFVRAGLDRSQVSLGNALRCRWHGSNNLPPVTDRLVREGLAHCRKRWKGKHPLDKRQSVWHAEIY